MTPTNHRFDFPYYEHTDQNKIIHFKSMLKRLLLLKNYKLYLFNYSNLNILVHIKDYLNTTKLFKSYILYYVAYYKFSCTNNQ